MKNIFDILNEMDGSSTPGNTMGMGNPAPPTETQPGSEPLCPTCKKKKKKVVKESVLGNDFDANADDTVKLQWVKDHAIGWDNSLDDQLYIKEGLIHFNNLLRLRITEDMPDAIQFGGIYVLDYALVKGCSKRVKINLPLDSHEVSITNFSNDKIESINITAGKKPWVNQMKFNGIIEHIDFPRDLKVGWLYMRDIHGLKLEGMSFPLCERMELCRKAAASYIVDKFKIKATKEFLLN